MFAEVSEMERTVLHCDCNSFFASVETVAHPEYSKVPMAVCGSVENRHGIVLAKNELAKKAGVSTGEVIWKAKQKCPSLLVVHPTYGLYSQYSEAVNSIYYEYTDRIEPFGIDESWLDVTGSYKLFGDGRRIADILRERIKRELGITISVGVSFTKTFAKLGSDYKKPDATTLISRENYKQLVFPLPVDTLLFVGRHTKEKLHMLGINTVGELAAADPSFLTESFGRTGESLYNAATGAYDGEVAVYGSSYEEKSIGNGCTFRRDIMNYEDARCALTVICDEVGYRMRKAGVKGRVVTVGMRDTGLSVITRRCTLENPTCSSHTLADVAFSLMKEYWGERKPLRSLTVTASDFIRQSDGEQLRLFYSESEMLDMRRERLERAVDGIRAKYGNGVLIHGVEACGNANENANLLLQ